MEASVLFRVVHSVSDIDNLRSDDTSMLYHMSCYKTYASRRNCGFFKVESAGSDHKPATSQVPLLNEQSDDTSTDIALCIFCGKQTFKKDRKLHKIKTCSSVGGWSYKNSFTWSFSQILVSFDHEMTGLSFNRWMFKGSKVLVIWHLTLSNLSCVVSQALDVLLMFLIVMI